MFSVVCNKYRFNWILFIIILVVAYFIRNTANASLIGILLSYVLNLVESIFIFMAI